MSEPAAGSTVSILERLGRAEGLLDGVDLGSVDAADLPAVTQVLRRIEGRCAAVAVAVAARAAATGADPGATLLDRGRVSGRRARQEAKRADVAQQIPEVGDALQTGEVSGEHLDAIARTRAELNTDEAAVFDRLGSDLATAATRMPVDTFAKELRTLVDEARADHGMTRLQQQRARSSLKKRIDPDGMGHLHVIADPERFAHLQTAIETRTASLAAANNSPTGGDQASGGSVTMGPALELDALIELVTTAGGRLGRPSITVVVDQTTLSPGPHDHTVCETDNGVALPAPVIERHLCDATVQHVTLDGAGLPLNVGRKYRTATPTQWAALKAIYTTCAWHRCDRPITWCQAHHIQHWEHGGPTNLDNLIPLCTRHHHNVHDHRWQLVLHPDRTLDIHQPPPDRTTHTPNPDTPWATTRPDRIGPRAGCPPAKRISAA